MSTTTTATGVTIRPGTAADVPDILTISNHYAETSAANFAIAPETLDEWMTSFAQTHERFPWYVAIQGRPRETASEDRTTPGFCQVSSSTGSVIAFAKASPWKGRCAYAYSAETTVYVHPEHHRRGLGRALYTPLIDTLRAQGYRTLLAGITLPNSASVALHEGFGFKRVAVLERVGWKFDRWHDVGYWELTIGAVDDPPRAIRAVRDVVESPSLL